MSLPRFGLLILLAGVACQSVKPVHKENIFGVPVVMPLHMCPEAGTVGMSLGAEGERMMCEIQIPLGTHLPRCTCWDEGMLAQQREDTQEIHHQMEVGIQTCMSGNCNDGGAGGPGHR